MAMAVDHIAFGDPGSGVRDPSAGPPSRLSPLWRDGLTTGEGRWGAGTGTNWPWELDFAINRFDRRIAYAKSATSPARSRHLQLARPKLECIPAARLLRG